ncbi:hypothetical protein [Dyadobacter sp. NIV53]|uniref:hypothetical protein n=1 Tax=Dyadobacter sp. NIV53 TaxID=2861765 RepID=UPI001C8732E5|nr:hypothetical protein [Dyadobacter sp. NIV53]
MKTYQLSILNGQDSDKVMNVLSGLVIAGMIEIKENVESAAAPSYDQMEEMIDESELAPYYSEQEVRNILHL